MRSCWASPRSPASVASSGPAALLLVEMDGRSGRFIVALLHSTQRLQNGAGRRGILTNEMLAGGLAVSRAFFLRELVASLDAFDGDGYATDERSKSSNALLVFVQGPSARLGLRLPRQALDVVKNTQPRVFDPAAAVDVNRDVIPGRELPRHIDGRRDIAVGAGEYNVDRCTLQFLDLGIGNIHMSK